MKGSKTKYLIRLDDACPFMDRGKWSVMEEILDSYGIKPLVGVIPDARDKLVIRDEEDCSFWEKARSWVEKGWVIALHGYDHCYVSDEGGINPLWNRSEFAGVPLSVQKDKIKKGYDILKVHGLAPDYFFAPSHTFDENTLTALRQETDIRIISDTISTKPYIHKDFLFIPQISGHCTKMPIPGIYTFCFHPNNMDDVAFSKLKDFLNNNKYAFTTFDAVRDGHYSKKSTFDIVLSSLFFFYRKCRGLK